MNEIKLPQRPAPDGFITIRIIGRDVEVNAYRDSTMGDYATQAVEADRAASPTGQAPCARVCEAQAFKIEIRQLKSQLEKSLAARGEPVAWVSSLTEPQPHAVTSLKYCSAAQVDSGKHLDYVPLYTAPQPAQQPLPAHEIVTMYEESPTSDSDMIEFARAIEAAHGIKETP